MHACSIEAAALLASHPDLGRMVIWAQEGWAHAFAGLGRFAACVVVCSLLLFSETYIQYTHYA